MAGHDRRRRSARAAAPPARPARTARPRSLTPERELALLQDLAALSTRARDSRDAEKSLRAVLRLAMDFFGAAEGCMAARARGSDRAEVLFGVPRDVSCDEAMVTEFINGEKVPVPPDVMFARMRRRGRRWGAIRLHHAGSTFTWEHRRALSKIAATATEVLERIDQARIREVRARIDRKIMEKIRPKDLFYQILDGIRSLTGYDHSAALLICNDDQSALEVVAEQIAWRKGKSRSIGRTIPIPPEIQPLLAREVVYGFRRRGDTWEEFNDRPADGLAEFIDAAESDGPPEAALICAPLVSRDEPLGILRVASVHTEALDDFEADLISRFLPQASVAIHNSRRTESLQQQMIDTERTNSMAVLARGVSHDVNNALGAVLPLVQEIRAEAADGTLDPDVVAADLREVERSLQACRRIFGGMLRFARAGERHVGPVHVKEAVQCTLDILREGLERRQITVVRTLADELPPIRGQQSELEQLLLNVLSNAGDATPPGGRIEIQARRAPDHSEFVELSIEDTGHGIPAHLLPRIREPFFTTKKSGFGLGLAICRSIIAQMRGRFRIENVPAGGTRVTMLLVIEEAPTP